MADMGFLPDVRRLLDLTPDDRQTLLFSATLDGDIDVLVRRYQHDPARHELEADEDDIPGRGAPVLEGRLRRPGGPDGRRRHGVRARPSCSAGPSTAPTGSPASSSNAGCGPRPSTATGARSSGSGRWTRSSGARSTRWWPPTWPPGASTSTGSTPWSTSTRRPTPRTTCTARGGRPGPAPPAWWSAWSPRTRRARSRGSNATWACPPGRPPPTSAPSPRWSASPPSAGRATPADRPRPAAGRRSPGGPDVAASVPALDVDDHRPPGTGRRPTDRTGTQRATGPTAPPALGPVRGRCRGQRAAERPRRTATPRSIPRPAHGSSGATPAGPARPGKPGRSGSRGGVTRSP